MELTSQLWQALRIPSRRCSPCSPRKAPGKKLVPFLCGLAIGGLLAGGTAWAQEPPAFKPPLQRQLESQILPEVRFQDADFMDALHYLQLQALTSSQNPVRVPFVVQLPADFKPRYELTLDLKAIPFWEALRHLGGQAGVEFSIAKDSVRIRPAGAEAATKPAVRTVIPAPAPEPATPDPGKGLTGRLGKPARPFGAAGGNNHYTTAGEPQPQRSGNQKHRNLSGWSVEDDPGNQYSMNCIDFAACKAHRGDGPCPCGCFACACQRPKDDKKAAPKP
jgi:hypothetical protein